ncbi:MAG: filamentous hemagglutinin N-terminal domain-containing protein, partial [Methylococcaceae bacterium]
MIDQAYQPPGGKRPSSLLATSILLCLYGVQAHANPAGPVIAHGRVGFDAGAPGRLNISNSPNAIINWRDFSVGRNEVTRFIQQSAGSAVLNRVVGNDPSAILGQLLSNGRIYLINSNGIIFGRHAVVDTAGFLASTLDISDNDFLKGNYVFTSHDAQGIENHGLIHTGKDGNIMLIAPDIKNDGVLHSEGGKITLAAGRELTISSLDAPEVSFKIQAPGDKALNLGQMLADGGGAVRVFAGTLSNSGEISADSMRMDAEGNIVLEATHDVTLEAQSRIHADGVSGGNIHIESRTGAALVAGTVEARGLDFSSPIPPGMGKNGMGVERPEPSSSSESGSPFQGLPPTTFPLAERGSHTAFRKEGQGGQLQILGEQVGLLNGAKVDASGKKGGGTVLVGGDYQGKTLVVHNAKSTYIDKGAAIKADAADQGDGGKVIVWADKAARFFGHISVKGGAKGGDGGFVETSGKFLDAQGTVDASAPEGRGGTWLLDPNNITIQATGSDANVTGNPDFATSGDSAVITTGTLQAALDAGTSVTITTGTASPNAQAGDITVASAIAKTAGVDATLTLSAHNNINLNAGITSSASALNLVFNADSDNSGAGAVNLANGASITLGANGGTIDASAESVNLSSGTATVNSAFTVGNLNFSGGTLGGTGALTVTGPFNITGSGTTLTGSGTLTTQGATSV